MKKTTHAGILIVVLCCVFLTACDSATAPDLSGSDPSLPGVWQELYHGENAQILFTGESAVLSGSVFENAGLAGHYSYETRDSTLFLNGDSYGDYRINDTGRMSIEGLYFLFFKKR
ncbi:hypothetical protein [Breznakiella homolactica]|uniref:Lipocalin-like domain-containing protein n=1 Tax=Breznakiella homolactica TaxID=2798577 RepID=A0A7T7XPD5_9SPIR|nr:hypothetical protein [Breznakiella homolactica]QQO10079.1 hypothetical protein JFL75_03950 [Breznakiella homolactica]